MTSPGSPQERVIRPLGRPGDLGWVLLSHGELYAAEQGWGDDFEALVVRVLADYATAGDRERQAGWIAELDGRRVGCVLCTRVDDETAQLRTLLVDPAARGLGFGDGLVRACLDFARAAGYRRVRLWTNSPLLAARRAYLRAGFVVVDEAVHRHFGEGLLGQTYEREL